MSRYTISAHDTETYEVVVGWDKPMRTFFAIVEDLTADDDEE